MTKPQTIDASRVRVVLFDLFGTVVDFSGVPYEERKAYADHLERSKVEWSPFRPHWTWERLNAFPDVREGMFRLMEQKRQRVILSNCPATLAAAIVARNMMPTGTIIQLAAARVFKPDPRAYQVALDVLDVPAESCLMVTANEKFGDLEQARALGMQAALIRGESDIPDIVALAERLGC